MPTVEPEEIHGYDPRDLVQRRGRESDSDSEEHEGEDDFISDEGLVRSTGRTHGSTDSDVVSLDELMHDALAAAGNDADPRVVDEILTGCVISDEETIMNVIERGEGFDEVDVRPTGPLPPVVGKGKEKVWESSSSQAGGTTVVASSDVVEVSSTQYQGLLARLARYEAQAKQNEDANKGHGSTSKD
ncbi:hypothetical protein ACHQM5_025653 [Ranunculus cassubicifolius]